MENIKITIIIPTYNAKEYLIECLNSVMKQTLKEIEIICVDDGSQDNTLDILYDIARKESRIKIYKQKHQGSGAARNLGLGVAKGEYIAFLDADDFYYDLTALEKMVSACETYDVSVCGSYMKILENGELNECPMNRNLWINQEDGIGITFREYQNDYNYQSFIFRRSLLIDNGIRFPNYLRYQDPPFLVKSLIAAQKIWIKPLELYCYRWGHQDVKENSKKIKYVLMGIRDNLKIAIKYDYDELYERLIEERLNGQYYESIITNMSDEVIELLNEIEVINSKSNQCLEIKALKNRVRYQRCCDLVRVEDAFFELESSKNQSFEIFRKTALLKTCGMDIADILKYMGMQEIYVYGAGEIGQMFLKEIHRKIFVKAVLDQSYVKQVNLLADDIPIVVTPAASFQEISYELIKRGINRKRIYAIHTILSIGLKDMVLNKEEERLSYPERPQFLITGAQYGNKGAQSMLFIAVSEIRKRFQDAVIWYLPVDDARIYTKELQNKYKFYFLVDGNGLKSQLYEILPQLTAIIDVSGYALSSYWENEWYMRILRISYHYEIPLYLMPQSFGPFDFSQEKQKELKRYLPYIRQIYAREESTYESLKAKYGLNNVKLSRDLVLQNKRINYDYIYHDNKEQNEEGEKLNTEHNIAIVPNIRTYEFGSKPKVLTLYHSIITWLLEKKKNVYILSYSEDIEACIDIYKMFKKNKFVHLMSEDIDCVRFSGIIKNFQFMIVSRYHAIIHAYKNNIPCIAIGWADKYDELLKSFQQEKYQFDIRKNIDFISVQNALEEMNLLFSSEAKKIGSILPTMQEENCFDILKENKTEYPYFVSAFSKDRENVEKSSSGGVFYELCKYIIGQGGMVYGAVQSGVTTVKHQRADNLEQAKEFRRSKYLKSNLNECFAQVKADLVSGKTVLFSGVGCQIAGLYAFLNRKYEKLFTCEVVCHGIPLTEALKKYVQEKEFKKGDIICRINFRDKCNGWKNNCLSEYYISGQKEIILSREHPVHSLYLQGINMETRCMTCDFAKLPRIADITLADFWQYEGNMEHNNRGISLIAVNSHKGENLHRKINDGIYWEYTTKEMALSSCRHMFCPPAGHRSNKAFGRLIKSLSFQLSHDLCSAFGEVVLAEDVCKIEELSMNYIFKKFQQDTQEIIYVIDSENKVIGIITYGHFIINYGNNMEWINKNFVSVRISEKCVNEIKDIFDKNKKINRIPILDDEGHLVYEVRRYLEGNGKVDLRKVLLPFAKLSHNHNKCFFVKRPDLLEDTRYYTEKERKRIKEGTSFSVMQMDWEVYRDDFKDVYGEGVTEEYIYELCKIPQIIKRGEKYQHVDRSSRSVNVINGCRVTIAQPLEYEFSIHMYGRCGVFGYAVEDKETLPSALQEICNMHNRKVRIINHGLWGAEDTKILHNLYCDIVDGTIKQQDVVVVYMAELPCMEELEKISIYIYDSTQDFHKFLSQGGTFFDRPGHMTAEGYKFLADFLYNKLKENSIFEEKDCIENKSSIKKLEYAKDKKVENYLSEIKTLLPVEDLIHKKIGSIVMNCNPFTKGHRYLIEKAIENADLVILFVLEENRSYFSFHDRFEMVKEGTKDLKNVYVIPSGKFIISTFTFPEYFLKEQNPNLEINAADDVEIFGKYIAPALNISIRFVGTEPEDMVTNQYNHLLKTVLPQYGLKLYEVPRLKNERGTVTATKVRKFLQTGKIRELRTLLPDSTFNYLLKNGFLEENNER